MHMEFHRNSIGILIGGYYIPKFMYALLSLVSYSLTIENVPGRLGLLVTLDLIYTTMYISVKAPESRGFSYIEIWNVGLQLPIIIGIFEYAVILAIKKYFTIGNEGSMGFDTISKKMDIFTFIGSTVYIIIFTIIYLIMVS